MNKNGPVMIVEDDEDDRELLADVFRNLDLSNDILFYKNGQLAFDELIASEKIPFLILSDIHMPGLSGPDLCSKVRNDEKLSRHHIPFVYFTTSTTRNAIAQAYAADADGFFIKPSSISQLQQCIGRIVDYWSECHLPSDYE